MFCVLLNVLLSFHWAMIWRQNAEKLDNEIHVTSVYAWYRKNRTNTGKNTTFSFILRCPFAAVCLKLERNVFVHLSDWRLAAAVRASSSLSMRKGTFLTPGDLTMRSSWRTVLSTCASLHKSTFVTMTKMGTRNASAKPRCSFVVPTTRTCLCKHVSFVTLRLHGQYWCLRTDSCARTDHKHSKVRWISCETEDSCFDVLCVATEVD